jgi:hypothetical protein
MDIGAGDRHRKKQSRVPALTEDTVLVEGNGC